MELDRELIARALPGYAIGDEIGRGGWGVVLRAEHRQLGRTVAVKQLPRALAAEPDVQRRFASEARLLASLDHPHIVPIFDYVEHEGLCLLVMELLPGGTVWQRFTSVGMSSETACGIVLASSTALEYAHRQGILHRDVKPENLLFTASGTVKVSDFGIAKVIGDQRTLATKTGEVLGTPSYMAPEQATGSELTPATDVYALGLLTYELLSGTLPFTGEENPIALLIKRVREAPMPLGSVAGHVPPALVDVVMRAIATAPADRYASAEAYGLALADAANGAWGRGWARASGIAVMAAGPIADRVSGGHDEGATAGPAQPVRTSPSLGPRTTGAAEPDSIDAALAELDAEGAAGLVSVDALVVAEGPPPAPPAAPPPPPAATPPPRPATPPPRPTTPPPRAAMPPPPPASRARRRSRVVPILLALVGVVAAGVVVAVVLASGGGDGDDGGGSGSSDAVEVTVPGNEAFTDTGIDVPAGATVRITSSGTVIHDLTTDPTLASGPDGDADRPDLQQFNVPELPDADHSGLIGKIGQSGAPFEVGSELELTDAPAGRLILGINDVGVFNNGGQFDVRVTVTPAGSSQ
jgi:serine/threonine-protein kinase